MIKTIVDMMGYWHKLIDITINTTVVVTEAKNPGNVGGFLASFSNGIVTDESWECASCSSRSCERWSNATSNGFNIDSVDHVWKKVRSIAENACWIWTTHEYELENPFV